MLQTQPCCCPHCGHCSKPPQYVYPHYNPWPVPTANPWWHWQPNPAGTITNANPDVQPVSINALNSGAN